MGNLLQIVLFNQLEGGAFIQPELLVQDLKKREHGQREEETNQVEGHKYRKKIIKKIIKKSYLIVSTLHVLHRETLSLHVKEVQQRLKHFS